MPKMRINCPNCRQPITAEIDQLLDAGADPSAKQRLLSGSFNLIQCPHCGYQGNAASLIVYHDPEKELLLTFVPMEMQLAKPEQERMIGALINQVINRLPQEKRKGYLLRPQETLTMQGLVERVLEKDGITREMIQAQQQKINLIQRLMSANAEGRVELAHQEDKLIDAEFFGLLRRLVEASLAAGDQEGAQHLADLQNTLLPETSFGREIQAQSQEIEAAVADLRALGPDLNQETLLDLVLDAASDVRVRALVSLARPVMDYTFFQKLTERSERAKDAEKVRLVNLREKLLELTRAVDQQIEARAQEARRILNELLKLDDPSEALLQNLPAIDEYFLHELNAALDQARAQGDLGKSAKLQKMVAVIQQASAAPPEVALIEELLDAEDEPARLKILNEHSAEINDDFMSALANIVAQVQGAEDVDLVERVQAVNRTALKFSMQKRMRG